MDEEEDEEMRMWEGSGPGMRWRIVVSIITFFGLLVFIILWLFFWADGYSFFQAIAVVLVAVLVFFAIMGATWASMWMGHRGGWW